MAAAKTDKTKRVYRKNKTKGSRKGSKWPEHIKTAALCDLLTGNNICAVAKKYGVPESTLRTWLNKAEKAGPDGKKSIFAEAREEAVRALQHDAAAGARASVRYIRRRLEANDTDCAIYAGAQARLDAADGISVAEEDEGGTALAVVDDPAAAMTDEERSALLRAMDRHRPMSDFAAANYLRALTSVTDKAGQLLGEDVPGQGELKIIIEEI